MVRATIYDERMKKSIRMRTWMLDALPVSRTLAVCIIIGCSYTSLAVDIVISTITAGIVQSAIEDMLRRQCMWQHKERES